jgi:hypothetical protein
MPCEYWWHTPATTSRISFYKLANWQRGNFVFSSLRGANEVSNVTISFERHCEESRRKSGRRGNPDFKLKIKNEKLKIILNYHCRLTYWTQILTKWDCHARPTASLAMTSFLVSLWGAMMPAMTWQNLCIRPKDQKPITKLAAKTKTSDQIHRFVQLSGAPLLWLRILTDFSQARVHSGAIPVSFSVIARVQFIGPWQFRCPRDCFASLAMTPGKSGTHKVIARSPDVSRDDVAIPNLN